MMQPVYIKSACAISPQDSFDTADFLKQVRHSDNGMLFAVDPDYRQYINPVAIRRMSRTIKMGITAGMKCLQTSGIEKIDGIITGTGRGSMTDTECFLGDMITIGEQALNPTYFIQSTYNSINGWLAMQTKCTGYNQTYVHRGFSLELAILDAQLLLAETTTTQHYLVGCFDEFTPIYFGVKDKIGYWKKQIPNSLDLLKHADTTGTIGGEGAAFFVLSNDSQNAIGTLAAMKMLQEPTVDELQIAINEILAQHHISMDDIDVLLCGMNGDSRHQYLYDTASALATEHTTIAAFKHLTGEYDTSNGFALWFCTWLFQNGNVPGEMMIRKGNNTGIKNILLVNHYILNNITVALVRR